MTEIRVIRFVWSPKLGVYGPTKGRTWTFEAPVDTRTGRILEPAPGGSWRAAEHAPAHSPAQILAYLDREAEQAMERRRQNNWRRPTRLDGRTY